LEENDSIFIASLIRKFIMELNPPLMGWSHEGLMYSLCQLKQEDEMFVSKFKNCLNSISKQERTSLNVLIFVLNKTSTVNEKMNVKLTSS
jgi:hypothetical protein